MSTALSIAQSLTSDETLYLGRLPDGAKKEVSLWFVVMDEVFSANRPLRACKDIAARMQLPGFSEKAIQRKYYAIKGGQSWRCLINGRKLKGTDKSKYITPRVIDAWHGYCDAQQRKYKPAYRTMVREYRDGKMIGDVDWTLIWQGLYKHAAMPAQVPPDMALPFGWSYDNFMHHKPRKVEEISTRIGAKAAHKHRYHVHSSRVGLHVGQAYVFDDMWHDFKLQFVNQKSSVRPLELAGADIASGFKFYPGLFPQTIGKKRENNRVGKKEGLKEKHMRFYLAHILCNVGFHKDGCTLYVEHGTAAISARVEQILKMLSGGLINIQRSGIEGVRQVAQLFRGKGGGNPRLKAGYESLHNLVHNELANLPAQTGKDRDHLPESLYGRDDINTKLLIAAYALTPERAAQLRFPIWEWNKGRQAIFDAYYNMNRRTDHNLEGWVKAGNVKSVFQLTPEDKWRDMSELDNLPAEQRSVVEAFIHREECHKVVMMTPYDVWHAGQSDLIKLPLHAVAMICGADLATVRPCPASDQIRFFDQEISAEPMWYETHYITPEGYEFSLQEGKEYQWIINPFDSRQLFVSASDGSYLGMCRRCDVPCMIGDEDRLHAEMGRAAKRKKEALSNITRRNRKQIKQRIEDADHNVMILTGTHPAEARSNDRKQNRIDSQTDEVDLSEDDYSAAFSHTAVNDDDEAMDMAEINNYLREQ